MCRRRARAVAGVATNRGSSDRAGGRASTTGACRTGGDTGSAAGGCSSARAGARADLRRADARCIDTHRAGARNDGRCTAACRRTATADHGRGEQHRRGSPSLPGQTGGGGDDVTRSGPIDLEGDRRSGCGQAARTTAGPGIS